MAAVNTFGGRPLGDPALLLRGCLARNLPTAHWHGRATVAVCPTGRRYGTATVLMALGDLSKLNLAADHDLILSDFRQQVTLKRYSILAAEAAIPGLADDPATAYLVVVADRRFHLDRSPFSAAYNLPDGAGGLVTGTTNGGTPWTWATMFADLWGKLPATPAGAAPTLPFTPDGRPEGWRFWGHPSAWQALNDVLDRLCCVLVYDPTADTFTIERQGSADAAGAAFVTAAKNDLAWDGRPVVATRTARPEKVLVRFRRDPSPAATDPFYTVTLSLTADASAVAGTTHLIADDLIALGATGAPSNAAALATRAAERLADFERSLTPAELTRVKAWRGLWPNAIKQAGSQAGGVCWGDRGTGWTTEIGVSAPPRGEVPGLEEIPASIGPKRNLPTNVCELLDEYGVFIGIRVEYTPVTFPPGTQFGVPFCVDSPDDCCDVTWWCLDGECVAVASGETPPGGALGPFGSEAECTAASSTRWYRVDGECVEVGPCEPAPTGGVGPFAAEGDCDDVGGGGPCPDAVTYTTATVSNETGDCICLPATLTYVAAAYPIGDLYAEWTTNTCPGNVSWKLMCNGGVYVLTVGGVPATPVSFAAGTLVFDSPDLDANCGGAGGTCRITLTA